MVRVYPVQQRSTVGRYGHRGRTEDRRLRDYGKLGAGGLGLVYEARHVISRRAEAMKVLLPSQMGTAEMVERFRREVPAY